MAYQALYRRWRPQGFDGIVGQDAVVTTLKNQIKSDRIGHAYLFCGTRGTGKTSAAKIFARAVNCPHAAEHDGNPCNECETCRAIAENRAMNVFEIDAASNNGVDNIRDIREQVEYPPVNGRFKVYIIDEVHMLSTGAFNALLKTLEEPPAYVIFILATTDPQKLPATILSRCQRYDFKRISKAQIAGHLKEITEHDGTPVEDKALSYIAEAADGSMRDSLSILDQCLAYRSSGETLTYEDVLNILGTADDSIYSELFRRIISHDVEGALEHVARLINDGCEASRLINDFIMYMRNVLLVKSMGSNDILELSEERYARALKDGEQTDNDTIIRIIASFSELANRTRFSTQRRTALEVELIRLCTYGMAAYAANANVSVPKPMPRPAAGSAANINANAYGSQTSRTIGASQQGMSPAAPRNAAPTNPMSAKLNISLAGVEDDKASHSGENAVPWNDSSSSAGQSTAEQDAASSQHSGFNKSEADLRKAPTAQTQSYADAEPHKAQTYTEQELPQQDEPANGSIYSIIMQNWDRLMAGLSPSNRPLFNDILVKEEGGKVVLVFKNQMNFRLAAGNKEENGVIRLRQLAEEELHLSVNFTARAAKPGEISTEVPKATPEELARINFPITIED